MTRPEAIEAAALREQGLTYQAIADRFSVSHSTVYRWLNPDSAAASNEKLRRDRQSNPEKTRLQQARHAHDECPGCDGQKRKSSTLCRSCRQAEQDERDALLSRLWGEGLSVREIADVFGIAPASAQGMVVRRRQAGVCLPQRRFALKERIESALLDRIEEAVKGLRDEETSEPDVGDHGTYGTIYGLDAVLAILTEIRQEGKP